ncbi:MAG: hypothetical protein ACD_77C00002G0002 [uncultured bacterium]|nr:MAG: hypothetical protein ACD_77C00002G0002 [uncultured bacterium]
MKDLNENKIPEPTFDKFNSDIKLFPWFKFIVGLLFSALLVYKLALSDLAFDFSKFDFNALLSMILALFAISLSVAFYFKATDTSNLFYDNTYKFTKEISEILGRIEAGFGERLRHLDEGYSGLANKFDKGSNEQNVKETKEEIEKEKQKLKEEIEERDKIFNTLLEQSQLESHEKEIIRQQLKEREVEISKQNRELSFLRSKLLTDSELANINELPEPIKIILVNYVKSIPNPEILLKYPSSIISKRFRMKPHDLTESDFMNLIKFSIIEEDGTFTIRGIKLIRQIAKAII